MQLRLYQTEVIEKIEHTIAEGQHQHRIMNVAPTGPGKTIIAAEIIQRWVAARKNVLVLAHTREIIKQISEKLFSRRIMHGVIQAGFTSRPLEHVQVASIQTLWRRAMRTHCMELPRADLLVIDECHHCPANTYRSIIESYPGAVLLGLTATPCRGDGRGLGSIFDIIIECPQVATLIEEGYLVKTKVYAPVDPDLHGVQSQGGDYVETQLAERIDRPNLIGDIVTHWHRYAERRKTVCFAVNVPHSMHIRDEFVNQAFGSGTLTATPPNTSEMRC
jgi:DNA repair protein RadD